jgi:hypothetical protein
MSNRQRGVKRQEATFRDFSALQTYLETNGLLTDHPNGDRMDQSSKRPPDSFEDGSPPVPQAHHAENGEGGHMTIDVEFPTESPAEEVVVIHSEEVTGSQGSGITPPTAPTSKAKQTSKSKAVEVIRTPSPDAKVRHHIETEEIAIITVTCVRWKNDNSLGALIGSFAGELGSREVFIPHYFVSGKLRPEDLKGKALPVVFQDERKGPMKGRVVIRASQLHAEKKLTAQALDVLEKLSDTQVLNCRVTGSVDFGVVVVLETPVVIGDLVVSVDAVIPMKELSIEGADLEVGKELQVVVLSVDKTKKRVRVSQLRVPKVEEPAQPAAPTFSVGQQVRGTISAITDDGVFVNITTVMHENQSISLAQGVDAFMSNEQIPNVNATKRGYRWGQELKLRVLSVEGEVVFVTRMKQLRPAA